MLCFPLKIFGKFKSAFVVSTSCGSQMVHVFRIFVLRVFCWKHAHSNQLGVVLGKCFGRSERSGLMGERGIMGFKIEMQ